MDKTPLLGAALAAIVVSVGSSASAGHDRDALIDHKVLPKVCSDALVTQGASLTSPYGAHRGKHHRGQGHKYGHYKHGHKSYGYSNKLVAHFPNGARAVKVVRHGRNHGKITCWFRSGRPAFETRFSHRELNGSVRQWYRSGAPLLKAHFRHGRPEGRVTKYFRNGKRSLSARYVDGQYQGRVRHWHPSGHLAFSGFYDCGVLVGRARHYQAYPVVYREPNYRRATPRPTVRKRTYPTRRTYAYR